MSERPDPDYVEPVPDDAESPVHRDEDDEEEEQDETDDNNPFHEDVDFPNPAKDI